MMIESVVESKNLHMRHAEDAVIDSGVNGTRDVINYFRSIRDMLAGNSSAPINLSVKWDGSPAIFAGTDPSDGRFFVAKKSVFNKNPKVYKTQQDIDNDLSGELRDKFTVALKEFSKLGIKGVVQGDFLYTTNDIKEDDIDGVSHITFHPNTIVYAVPKESELAKQILKSRIGVVWHTSYGGSSFETMSATFGTPIAKHLKKVSNVWSIDALYEDKQHTVKFTKKETDDVTAMLSYAGSLFNKVNPRILDDLRNNKQVNSRINNYINSKVRLGEQINDVESFVGGLGEFIKNYYQKQSDLKKTPRGKNNQMNLMYSALSLFVKYDRKDIENVFALYNILVNIKLVIINKLNTADGLKTLLKTTKGYEVTGQEGFVAIDRYGKNSLKLVDRLQFSKANFSSEYLKGWQK